MTTADQNTMVFEAMTTIFAAGAGYTLLVGGLVIAGLFGLLIAMILLKFGALWFQAYMSGADVSVMSLIGMSFRQVKPMVIVTAKIMGSQARIRRPALRPGSRVHAGRRPVPAS